MKRKRFVKLMMGKGLCRNEAEYRARLVIGPGGPGTYQKQWDHDVEVEKLIQIIYDEARKWLAERGLDVERIC